MEHLQPNLFQISFFNDSEKRVLISIRFTCWNVAYEERLGKYIDIIAYETGVFLILLFYMITFTSH